MRPRGPLMGQVYSYSYSYSYSVHYVISKEPREEPEGRMASERLKS